MTTPSPSVDALREILDEPELRTRARRFIVPALIGLILLVLAVMIKQGYFVRRVELNFYAPTADGVSVGTKIKLLGFPIGSVTGVRFIPAGDGQPRRVSLAARVDAEYLAHIPSGSHARLGRDGLIGESLIEILPGSDSARPIASGESIELVKEGGFGELANKVETRILPVADEVRTLLQTMNDGQTGVKPLMSDLKNIAGTVAVSTQQAQSLLARADKRVEAILGESEAALKSAHAVIGAVEKRADGLLDDTQATLKNLRAASGDGARIAQDVGKAAPALIAEGQAVADDVAEITSGAKRAWPIRLFVTEPASESLGVDTARLPPSRTEPVR